MESVYVCSLRHFFFIFLGFITDLLCDDRRDGVGVRFHPGIELQQVFYVDWLFAHQGDRPRIGLIRYRRHLSARGGF